MYKIRIWKTNTTSSEMWTSSGFIVNYWYHSSLHVMIHFCENYFHFSPRSAQMDWWWWREWVTIKQQHVVPLCSTSSSYWNEYSADSWENKNVCFVSIIDTKISNTNKKAEEFSIHDKKYGLVWLSVRLRTRRNVFIVNTSMFFFIMIEFSRFFKRQKTGCLHYYVTLESICSLALNRKKFIDRFQSELNPAPDLSLTLNFHWWRHFRPLNWGVWDIYRIRFISKLYSRNYCNTTAT